jgi:hypothetical protein
LHARISTSAASVVQLESLEICIITSKPLADPTGYKPEAGRTFVRRSKPGPRA